MSPETLLSNHYINVLEKTNQQLNLWYNPYAIIIGALAVLFTILTIVAVVIIYLQSQDYKEKMKADRELYRKNIEEFLNAQKEIIEKQNKNSEEISKKIDVILSEYKKKLKESSEKQKEEIQKAIDRLEIEKLTLKTTHLGPVTVSPNIIDYNSPLSMYSNSIDTKLHTCSKCGFGFFVNNNDWLTATGLISRKTVTCPSCGNTESI